MKKLYGGRMMGKFEDYLEIYGEDPVCVTPSGDVYHKDINTERGKNIYGEDEVCEYAYKGTHYYDRFAAELDGYSACQKCFE